VDALPDLELVFFFQGENARDECPLKTSITAPPIKPFPDRGMADFFCSGYWINTNGNLVPLASGVQLIQNVIEDPPEGNLGLTGTQRKREMGGEKPFKLLFGHVLRKVVPVFGFFAFSLRFL